MSTGEPDVSNVRHPYLVRFGDLEVLYQVAVFVELMVGVSSLDKGSFSSDKQFMFSEDIKEFVSSEFDAFCQEVIFEVHMHLLPASPRLLFTVFADQ
jgi:hypothetical protein